MNKGLNLNNLRDEIDNRKKEKNIVSSRLGESVGTGAAPRDVFLNGLLESLHTGRETASSALMKTVDNRVSEKNGEKAKLPISNNVVTPSTTAEAKPKSLWEKIIGWLSF